jgi:S-adenosylmethionine synthetase
MCPDEAFYVDPTGRFVLVAADGDAGPTGRKDHCRYLMAARRPDGGGASLRKDPTKVDRQQRPDGRAAIWPKTWWRLAWPNDAPSSCPDAIGVSKPLSVYVDTHQANSGWTESEIG